jgi:ribose 5-phosphate isomerase A
MQDDILNYKQEAAKQAAELISSGIVLGLGCGSTAEFAVQDVAERIQSGELQNILAILCSPHQEPEARRLGIPLTTLEDHTLIDLTIDGADEVDPQLNLIKGGGGALLREKIIAQASQREIIIVDERKLSPVLGTRHPVPVEVIPFGWKSQQVFLESLGAQVALRKDSDGAPFYTDQKNLILDCTFGPISDLAGLSDQLSRRAGIVEHGIFLNLATDLIVAGRDGIRHIQKK